MRGVGKGPSTAVAQAAAWQTALTVITCPGWLWVWVAASQKPPDRLPCFMPSLTFTGGATSHILKQNMISLPRSDCSVCVFLAWAALATLPWWPLAFWERSSRFLGCCPEPVGFVQGKGILHSALACFLAPNILKANFSISWLFHMLLFIYSKNLLNIFNNTSTNASNIYRVLIMLQPP